MMLLLCGDLNCDVIVQGLALLCCHFYSDRNCDVVIVTGTGAVMLLLYRGWHDDAVILQGLTL